MDRQEMIDRAVRAAAPTTAYVHERTGRMVQFGPIELAIITAAIGAVIGELVGRCFRKLAPESIASPGWLQRRRLRRLCRNAVQQAATERPSFKVASTCGADVAMEAIEARVYEGVLALGRSMTEDEIAAVGLGR